MYTKEYNNCGKNQNLEVEKFYMPNLDAGSRDAARYHAKLMEESTFHDTVITFLFYIKK